MAANNREPEDEPKEPTLTYENYLNIEKLLSCLQLRSPKFGKSEHDEHLFITVHQAHELWFRQMIFEVDSIRATLRERPFDETRMLYVNNRMDRIILILKLLLDHLSILETMHPVSYFNFRDYLSPASGFQSAQFRVFENKVGIKPDDRIPYMMEEYQAKCNPDKQQNILDAADEDTLFRIVERWLEQTHGLEEDGFNFWKRFGEKVDERLKDIKDREEVADAEEKPVLKKEHDVCKDIFQKVLNEDEYKKLLARKEVRLSHKALQGALMISFYRNETRLQQSFQFLTKLVDVDAFLSKWRYNHVLMVHRMIGAKPGAGGSSGYHYLKATISDKYRVFLDFFNLSTFYLPQKFVPVLTESMKTFLSPAGNQK
ncbi:tryptophan 2,3-dioxygenase A-like [Lytechinus variegatus]|uniref:tryptophan 2,3-dioxygenase A-like n=1 Tax=Lytechinus variegatus TaxID=7654 RepID=UPI001BB19C82|nr:tryptophan 2,3-dioxygenase A-like [Lytechinus variegatus]